MDERALANALAYANEHQERFLNSFQELLRFPSISTDPAHQDDLEACGDWILAEMERIGFQQCRKMRTDGHPVLYGEWLQAGPAAPTAIIYAHYDVQPVDPLALWESPPFEPTRRDQRLYARGVVDNKCGVWGNLKVFESLIEATGELPLNIKLCFEGEEESGSPNMAPFVTANKDVLTADLLVNSDGEFNRDQPRQGYAARGIVAAEITVHCARADLHSGQYGGVVHNPNHVIGAIIASFHDAAGRIQIGGYYDDVRAIDEEERERLRSDYAAHGDIFEVEAGTEHFWAESLAPRPERATVWPTLDVNGIIGGYQGPGMKTVIPAEASCKVTMRIVPEQDPERIAELFQQHVMQFASETADVRVRFYSKSWPFSINRESAAMGAMQRALEATVGKRATFTRGGGSIPILGMFQRELGMPMTTLGFGAGSGVHAPNEYMDLPDFRTAIQLAIRFYSELGQLRSADFTR